MVLVRNVEQIFGLLDSTCQVPHLDHVVLNLKLCALGLVQIRLCRFLVVANGRPQSVVKVIFEGVDPTRLVLLERLPVRLDHFDQIGVCLLLESLSLLQLGHLVI